MRGGIWKSYQDELMKERRSQQANKRRSQQIKNMDRWRPGLVQRRAERITKKCLSSHAKCFRLSQTRFGLGQGLAKGPKKNKLFRNRSKEPEGARRSEEERGGARRSEEEPGGARRSQDPYHSFKGMIGIYIYPYHSKISDFFAAFGKENSRS